MARSVYIASLEGHSGKSLVALGVVDALTASVQTPGIFRPVTRSRDGDDHVLRLLLEQVSADLGYEEAVGVTYDEVHADPDAALETIVTRYRAIERRCEAAVIVGSDYTDVAGPTELTFNAKIAANLAAPVLIVVSSRGRTADEIHQVAEMAISEIGQSHASMMGIVANRCDPAQLDAIRTRLTEFGLPAWAVPEVPLLSAPAVRDVAHALDAEFLLGDPALLAREAESMLVCGMNTEHVLEQLEAGQLCISAADRPEVLIALATANAAEGFPSLAGIVLNGGYEPSPQAMQLVAGLGQRLPILTTRHSTYDTARIVASTRGYLDRASPRKVDVALRVFEHHVDTDLLLRQLELPPSDVVTPLMFEANLLERARGERRTIVLPEGRDERILRAASTIMTRGAADLILLGVESELRARATELGLDIDGVQFMDPATTDLNDAFAKEYTRLRAHRGVEIDRAREIMRDVSYFGTMMVHLGFADGMVSGAMHTTAHTITPSFEIIKTEPDVSVVSSVFLMSLADRVLVYGDCAVIPDPTAEQLADIAISSAATAYRFGIEPRIAMLSYATGLSSTGFGVDKVRTATELVKERRPDLPVDGPMQYDAAVDAAVGEAKLPGSTIAGRATVFVFPDLNTGNNTYKAVQRSAGAVAIGPVLQGLNKPVNDLSRGATVRDIVNTVAITAIQAQGRS